MADAEDLKSSGDFSSCGFDSHPGHQCAEGNKNPPCQRMLGGLSERTSLETLLAL
jgi:hypothetical protein